MQIRIKTLDDLSGVIYTILSDVEAGSPLDEGALFNLRVVLNELIINALTYGGAPEGVLIEVRRRADIVDIAVHDNGGGFDIASVPKANIYANCGRGIEIVKSLCDSLEYDRPRQCVHALLNVG